VKALLDTHILFRWLSGIPRLSSAQTAVLEEADEENPLWVSEITFWELATLHSLGRIKLKMPFREWLERAVAPPRVQCIGITPAIAAEVANLPDSFHHDPADRVLVSTARVLPATLLTQDKKILQAGLVETLS
jgi:PIN domain nuclease of toxin-antitoxin system